MVWKVIRLPDFELLTLTKLVWADASNLVERRDRAHIIQQVITKKRDYFSITAIEKNTGSLSHKIRILSSLQLSKKGGEVRTVPNQYWTASHIQKSISSYYSARLITEELSQFQSHFLILRQNRIYKRQNCRNRGISLLISTRITFFGS